MPELTASPDKANSQTPRFPFPQPLAPGRLVRRYKRFIADILLDDGTLVTAHCPNSGSMLGMAEPGSPVLLSRSDNPKRKLPWTWELVRPTGSPWVGCNTMRPNDVVTWAIGEGLVPGVDADAPLRREVRYGENSRIDILAGGHHVEVKNTTMARPTHVVGEGPGGAARDESLEQARPLRSAQPERVAIDSPPADARRALFHPPADARQALFHPPADARQALFPDAVTTRGAKHMRELADVARSGVPATVVFFVNRADCDRFAVARDIDPSYGMAFDEAVDAGVNMLPLGMDVSPDGWRVRGRLPVA